MKFRVEFTITAKEDDEGRMPSPESFKQEIEDALQDSEDIYTGPVEIKILRIDEMEE